jgi:hypothetical protein
MTKMTLLVGKAEGKKKSVPQAFVSIACEAVSLGLSRE